MARVAAVVSSMSPGSEGETQTALPMRSITSQPVLPVRVCPSERVTTVKVAEALPPEGWVQWTLPACACLQAKVEGDCTAAFRAGLGELERRGLSLAGAAQECRRPAEGGQLCLFFPFKRL